MSSSDPFGFTPTYRKATSPSPSRRFRSSSEAMKPPSPFFSGTVISWPSVNPLVHAVEVLSTRRRWSRQMKSPWSLRTRPPGSRWDSTRIWKPLQMPSTGIPALAASMTSLMIGERAAIAPQRR